MASAPRTRWTPQPSPRPVARRIRADPAWAAIALAAVLAASPLAQGYFDFQAWGPLALAVLVIVVGLFRVRRPTLTGTSALAAAGLAILLALSASSWLWAEAKESAWTDINRLALYCALFATVLLAVRDCRSARLIMITLGSAALIASLWLCVAMVVGGAGGRFPGHRLDFPIGYVNADAGLLVMGIWPWLALAETARRASVRASALGASSLIAGTFVLTQSRSVIPACVVAPVLVLLCTRGRSTRALNLLLMAGAVAAGLMWTLRVYSAGGAAARSAPPAASLLRHAAIAILVTALAASLVRLGMSAVARRMGRERSARARRRLVVAVVVFGAPLLVIGAVAARSSITREYHSFTAMRFNDAAPVRLLDAGGYRYDLWRVAWHEFERHPLGGLGAGNYDVEYYRLRQNPEYVLQPHSLELQMAAELGVGGILALLLFSGSVIWASFARRGTLASTDRFVKVAAAGMFAAWLTCTSVDWLYDVPGLTGMAIVAAALLVARDAKPRPRGVGLRPRALLVAGLAIAAVLAASVGRQYAAMQYARSGTAKVKRDPRGAEADLRRALAIDPYAMDSAYALSAAYARQDNYAAARGTLLSAAAREPHNAVPSTLLGDLATRRGDPREAQFEYAHALALDPRDTAVRLALRNAGGAR